MVKLSQTSKRKYLIWFCLGSFLEISLRRAIITGPYKAAISPKRDPLNILEVNFELASFKTLISKNLHARITIAWNPICH